MLNNQLVFKCLCSHGDICPHSSSCTKDVLKLGACLNCFRMRVPGPGCWATELLIARAAQHDGDPMAAARGCPHPLADGHQSSLSICSLETDVLRVFCITVFFLTVKSASSFCPLFRGKGFLKAPHSKISTNLHGSLLHRYALSTQNTVWLKNSLPDTCAFWFGYVAGIFSFYYDYFYFFGSCFNEMEAKPNSSLTNGEK